MARRAAGAQAGRRVVKIPCPLFTETAGGFPSVGNTSQRGGGQVQNTKNTKETKTQTNKTSSAPLTCISNCPKGVLADQSIVPHWPAGVQHGVTFKFSGMGDDSIKNQPRGDLMVVMSVLDSDGFTRRGNDLYTDKTVSCFDAIRGCEVEIKELNDNVLKVKIPAGTQPGTL